MDEPLSSEDIVQTPTPTLPPSCSPVPPLSASSASAGAVSPPPVTSTPSLMEWGWNPVRTFMSRLQNLSAWSSRGPAQQQTPNEALLPRFSFSWGSWWGGSTQPKDDKEEKKEGDAVKVEKGTAAKPKSKFSWSGWFGGKTNGDDSEQKIGSEISEGGDGDDFDGDEEEFLSSKSDAEGDDDDDSEDDYYSEDEANDAALGDDDDDDDLFLFGNMPVNPMLRKRKSPLFMDKYTKEQLFSFVTDYVFKNGRLAGSTMKDVFLSKGYDLLSIDLDTTDPFVHKLGIYGAPSSEIIDREIALLPESKRESKKEIARIKKQATVPFTQKNLLAHLFVRRDASFSVMEAKSFSATESGVPPYYANAFSEGLKYLQGYFGSKKLNMLVIEWLRLQDPRASFGTKMPLPGQLHPGLGMGTEIDGFLVEITSKSQRDGILNIPEHWYNAYMYTKSSRPYKFLNPAFQGYFQSVCDAVEHEIKARGLPAVAWAIFRGMLRCKKITKDNPVVPPFITQTFAAAFASFRSTSDHSSSVNSSGNDSADKKADSSSDDKTTTDSSAADDDGEVAIKWVSQEQVCPISWQMSYYFSSPSYSSIFSKYYHPEAFYIKWDEEEPSDTPSSQ